jgi:hypothetical protein
LKSEDLPTDFTAWAHIAAHIEVIKLVFNSLLIFLGQRKALRLLSTEGHCEDDRASFTDSIRSVDVREKFRATQGVVGELDTELVTLAPLQRHYRKRRACILGLLEQLNLLGNVSKTQATMVDVAVEFSRYIWFMYEFYAILVRAIFSCNQL